MRVNLAKSAGFCFGVKRALDIAINTAKSETRVYILGDIVHNEEIVKMIKQLGVKKIDRLSSGKNKVLLIRAHGARLDTIKKARLLGYRIIDATCPMVKEIHKTSQKMERNGYKVIIIGDKKHDEVLGIIGQLKKKSIVIDRIDRIPSEIIKKIKKAAVVVQSTQNLEKTVAIIDILRRYISDLKFFNTICHPTRMKQKEIKTMPLENDAMIIIGSKKSANTRRLYEISKTLNKRSYWIQSKEDINPEWFKKGVKSVGVTSGSSTPEWITGEIVEYLNRLT